MPMRDYEDLKNLKNPRGTGEDHGHYLRRVGGMQSNRLSK